VKSTSVMAPVILYELRTIAITLFLIYRQQQLPALQVHINDEPVLWLKYQFGQRTG